jgi:hypothetical protein
MGADLLIVLALLDAADEVSLEVEEAGLVVEQFKALTQGQVLTAQVEDLLLPAQGCLG